MRERISCLRDFLLLFFFRDAAAGFVGFFMDPDSFFKFGSVQI
jgi:hypothetical protein